MLPKVSENHALISLKIKDDPMCPLCGEEYDNFLEDAVLSLEMKKTVRKTFLSSKRINTGTLSRTLSTL